MTPAAKKYKQEAEEQSRARDMAERKLRILEAAEKKRAEDSKKRYSATVYCTNCMQVNSVSIPPGVSIEEGDCVTCRVRNCQKLVVKVNC